MKKIFFLIACTILLSCSKEPNNPPAQGEGSVQYKVNGQLVTMDNKNAANGEAVIFAKQLKGSILPDTRYLFNGQKGVNNILVFMVIADSLHEINYHYDSTMAAINPSLRSTFTLFNAEESMLYFKGDYFDINISSYKNSRISGTFSAKFSPLFGTLDYNTRGTILITEGEIKNVQVVY